MTLTLDSTRFGPVEIDPDSVIEFPDGLIGLAGHRYALVTRDASNPLTWLHSLDDPSLALPVANPHQFFSDFEVELTDEDAERSGLDADTPVEVFVTVRAASAIEDFTANVKAPILVHAGRGFQVINQAPESSLRAPLFAETLAAGNSAPPASAC